MTRLAWWLIRAVSWLTPRALRARWVEEWHAEIEHASAALGTRRRDRLRVVRMAAGAVPDAIALRRLARHPFHGLTQDVRQAGRALIAAPGFSLGVIGSVTLGIAVNAGAFATINALFFRPVPGVESRCSCSPSRA